MSSEKDKNTRQPPIWAAEPFRVFFPMGTMWSLLGVFFWVLKVYDWGFEETSTKVHVWIQLYGFMTCFVIGFLGTAIPFFTGTTSFRPVEALGFLALNILTIFLVLFEIYFYAHLTFLVTVISFASCMAVRAIRGEPTLPPSFVFMPFAFLSAILGSSMLIAIWHGLRWQLLAVGALGRNLLFQGFIIFLLLGVGGFMIPQLLKGMPLNQPAAKPIGWQTHVACAVGILLSFLLGAFVNPRLGMGFRALFVTLEALGQIKIHQKPIPNRLVPRSLQLSIWLLVTGLWGATVAPTQFRLAFLHFSFVGGFALTVFAVATHVILSHCGFKQLLAQRSNAYLIAVILMMLGLTTRVSTDFIFPIDYYHYAYAGAAWCLGVLIWCVAVLPKIVKHPTE